ncbi:MAG: ribulose-bisphosphate carboxylase large subunit family protein [Phreatobacter sp.]
MTTGAARREFLVRYAIETPEPLEKTAEVIAGEQSSGTFLAIAGETEELKARARARVVRVEPAGDRDAPSLFSAQTERRGRRAPFHRGIVEIAFPIDNVGPNLPALMTTIAGNLFELGELTGIRLVDFDLPDDYARSFPGPRFGIAGTRAKAGVAAGPVVGTIIKPSIGMTPAETAELVDKVCAASIDFIKDDELIANPPYAPFAERVKAVMPVIDRHADRLGRKPMMAFNITGGIDEMRRHHDLVVEAGGTCVMVSVNWIGIAALEHLRSYSAVPIHGHRNGWGLFTRASSLGFAFTAYQKLWRLAGVDQLHVNGIRNKFWESDETVIASARSCLAPFGGVMPVMPVFSSGQSAGQVPDTHAALGSTDLMFLAGGGIIGHPGGIAAGVASIREGFEAASQGIAIGDFARTRPALRQALDAFGGGA